MWESENKRDLSFSCLESTVLEFLSPPLCGDSRVESISVESIHRGSQHEELRGPKTTPSGFLPSRVRESANLQWSTVVMNDAFDGNKRKSATRVCVNSVNPVPWIGRLACTEDLA